MNSAIGALMAPSPAGQSFAASTAVHAMLLLLLLVLVLVLGAFVK